MWSLCRAAVLRQLTRNHVHARLAVATTQQLQQNQWEHLFTTLAGVDRELLLSHSAKTVSEELGDRNIRKVRQALSKEFDETAARADVSSDDIKEIFTAAQKTGARSVLMRAFHFMEETFPSKIDFTMYGEVFRMLQRNKDGKKMTAIYERARPRFQSVPEMIYRFGIVGKLEQDDLEGATAIWNELQADGHEVPNEITSRVMMAHARAGNVDKVLELYDSVDTQIGQWHESAINRVILTMGLVGQPQKAFEFYSNSSMKLNGGTLITLLSVCINNNCTQQAADILVNRKRFDLHLDARAYNRIMRTLEFLNRHEEIADILQEMKTNNVRFDSMTRMIIDENREHLKGTQYYTEQVETPMSPKKLPPTIAGPKIRELLEKNEGAEAAAIIDQLLKPLEPSDVAEDVTFPEGALKVPPSFAKDAIRAYVLTNQYDKVDALLKTFNAVEGRYGHALAEIMTQFGPQGTTPNATFVYRATKAMLFQGRQIFRVNDALQLFHSFHDVDATWKILEQVLQEYSSDKVNANGATVEDHGDSENEEYLDGDQSKSIKTKRFSQFNLGRVINRVLQTLVQNGQLPRVLSAFDLLETHGLQATAFNYVVIFSSMRDMNGEASVQLRKNKQQAIEQAAPFYTADQFEQVWDDMVRRNIKISKSIVGNVCLGFAHGNKRQRLKLLEAYADVKNQNDDTYVLPSVCYQVLLQLTAKDGQLAEMQTLYDEAMQSLTAQPDRRVPRDWMTTMIIKLSEVGQVQEAYHQLMDMQSKTGNYSYEALFAVLHAAIHASEEELVAKLLTLFEEREFQLSLREAAQLVDAAKEKNMVNAVIETIRLFENANLNVDVTTGAPLSRQLIKRSFRRQNAKDYPLAIQTMKIMYSTTLQVCEQNGMWKKALWLNERATQLWGENSLDRTRPKKQSKKKSDDSDTNPVQTAS